jgi:hypothetical protein
MTKSRFEGYEMKTKPSNSETLSSEEIARIKDILESAESSGYLSDWESDFIDDLRERFIQYGSSMLMSSRQWDVLDRIEAKL